MNTGPLNEVFVLKRVAKWTYFAYTTQIDTPGGGALQIDAPF